MMTLTHLVTSAMFTSMMLGTSEPLVVGAGALAGLLPDIDLSVSVVGRIFPPVSRYLERRFSHRSFTHSFMASLVVVALTYPFGIIGIIPIPIIHAINIGYFIGWFLDACSKSGVECFYPARVRGVFPANRNLRVSTGSEFEYGLLALLTLLLALTLYVNANGGAGIQVGQFLGLPESVSELVREHGADYQILIDVEGVRSNDNQRIKGEYELVENKDKVFIVKSKQGELYKLCSDVTVSPDCSITALRMVSKLGKRSTTEVQDLVLNDNAVVEKLNQVISNHQGAEVYLTGKLTSDDIKDLIIPSHTGKLQTVKKTATEIEFEDCPVSEALQLLGDADGSGSLNVRIIRVSKGN